MHDIRLKKNSDSKTETLNIESLDSVPNYKKTIKSVTEIYLFKFTSLLRKIENKRKTLDPVVISAAQTSSSDLVDQYIIVDPNTSTKDTFSNFDSEEWSVPAKQSANSHKTTFLYYISFFKKPIILYSTTQTLALGVFGLYIWDRTNNTLPTTPLNTIAVSKNDSEIKITDQYQFLPEITNTNASEPNVTELASITANHTQLSIWAAPWNIDSISEITMPFDSISAFWLTLDPNGISVTPKAPWTQWRSYRTQHPEILTYLTVTANPNHSYTTISNPSVRSQHIQNLLKVVTEEKFDGIDIDYEGLGQNNRADFNQFIIELSSVFKEHNKKVAVTVEARLNSEPPMDWSQLSKSADEMRIMAYDYHGRETGFPGPIAPVGWVKEVLDYAVKTIEPKKIVIGFGNYGYDWKKVTKISGTKWQGTGLSYNEAIELAQKYSAIPVRVTGLDDRGYDIGAIPTFEYTDENKNQHSVWFEDYNSLSKKFQLTTGYNLRGVIIWSVGSGDTNFWQSVI